MREKLIGWIDSSQPGDKVIYHVGSLQYDRNDRAVNAIGNAMWEAMENHKVSLVQRKAFTCEGFYYIAIKRSPRKRKEWA